MCFFKGKNVAILSTSGLPSLASRLVGCHAAPRVRGALFGDGDLGEAGTKRPQRFDKQSRLDVKAESFKMKMKVIFPQNDQEKVL